MHWLYEVWRFFQRYSKQLQTHFILASFHYHLRVINEVCSVVTNFGFIIVAVNIENATILNREFTRCIKTFSEYFAALLPLHLAFYQLLFSIQKLFCVSFFCWCSFYLFSFSHVPIILYFLLFVFIIPRFIRSLLVCHNSLLCISHTCRKDRMSK